MKLVALLAGRAQPFGRGESSAIAKQAFDHEVRIGREGFENDEQVDRASHGGPDMALHHYCYDHYTNWRGELGDIDLLQVPGAFGENLSTLGATEDDICLGDVCRFGSARLQVSQGRQPCWKLDHRFGRDGVAGRVVASGRTGWYWRVLEPGTASSDERLKQLDRPRPDWPVSRLVRVMIARKARDGELTELRDLPELSEEWRTIARKRSER